MLKPNVHNGPSAETKEANLVLTPKVESNRLELQIQTHLIVIKVRLCSHLAMLARVESERGKAYT